MWCMDAYGMMLRGSRVVKVVIFQTLAICSHIMFTSGRNNGSVSSIWDTSVGSTLQMVQQLTYHCVSLYVGMYYCLWGV